MRSVEGRWLIRFGDVNQRTGSRPLTIHEGRFEIRDGALLLLDVTGDRWEISRAFGPSCWAEVRLADEKKETGE